MPKSTAKTTRNKAMKRHMVKGSFIKMISDFNSLQMGAGA
jgi:hypothetical protein